MGEDPAIDKQPSEPTSRGEADAALEREIRAERKFTLVEAIGRMAGPGSMKGASPVTRAQQVASEIETWLRQNLADSPGALRAVLLQRIRGSEMLLKTQDSPLAVLADYCRTVVDSGPLLADVVRDADREWGRVFDERPHFDKESAAPHSDDPYTIESVRRAINGLVEQLKAGGPA